MGSQTHEGRECSPPSSRNHRVNHVGAEDPNFLWMQRGAAGRWPGALGVEGKKFILQDKAEEPATQTARAKKGQSFLGRKVKSVVSHSGFNTFLKSE